MQVTDEELETLREIYRMVPGRPRIRKLLASLSHEREVSFRGLRLFVYPKENFTDRIVFVRGDTPEPESLDFLVERVKGKKAFVADIGANSGTYTTVLTSVIAKDGMVLAFEPNPKMMQRLEHNMGLNKFAAPYKLLPEAVGASKGEAVLNIHPSNLGQSSIKNMPYSKQSVSVKTTTLADIFKEAEPYEIRVLKIDVEGFESEAMSTFEKIKEASRPEIILMETKHANQWSTDVIAELAEAGYKAEYEGEGNTAFVLKK